MDGIVEAVVLDDLHQHSHKCSHIEVTDPLHEIETTIMMEAMDIIIFVSVRNSMVMRSVIRPQLTVVSRTCCTMWFNSSSQEEVLLPKAPGKELLLILRHESQPPQSFFVWTST